MHLARRTLCWDNLHVGARAVRHRCLLSATANQSSNDTVTTQQQAAQQQQQPVQQQRTGQQRTQQIMPQVPSLMEMLSTHGARLTTAAQMVWAQVGCALPGWHRQQRLQSPLMEWTDDY
jgi:hypothetical protein